ncbi:MAG TPA: hypothetical protein VFE27_07335 [Acidobacteriaceae bacterium]|nr:hypothetical protein [Acidobacteriaceae bacterium]
MRAVAMLAFSLLAVTSLSYSQGMPVNAVQSRINTLASDLRSNGIEQVEVLRIPPRVLTRTRVTPAMLERGYHYKLTIRDLRGGAYQPDLLAAVAATVVQPAEDMGDLRWGIIFFDTNGQRVASLYFDASGHRGAVDSTPVSFQGGIGEWLSTNFSKAFR